MSYIVSYDPSRNPEGDAIPGVPLDNLDADALAQIPAHRLPSIPAFAPYTIIDQAAWDTLLPPPPAEPLGAAVDAGTLFEVGGPSVPDSIKAAPRRAKAAPTTEE